MRLFDTDPGYDVTSVREVLAHSKMPKITQSNVYSMEPSGLYGTVYEDPRGDSILKVSAVVAFVIGLALVLVGGFTIYHHVKASQALPASVAALSSQPQPDIPMVSDLVGQNDGDIMNTLSASYSMYQLSDTPSSMSAVRLPDNMDAATLALYYQEGIGNLDADQAASVLSSAWFISTDHSDEYRTIKVRYADFSSGSIDYAVSNAMKQQGMQGDNVTVLSEGVDDNKNTYKYGTMDVGGRTIYWRVAACNLDEVYAVDGLPSGYYVGITESTKSLMDISENEESSPENSSASA